MPMSVHIDSHEVYELVIDLSHAPDRLKDNVGTVFKNEADALRRDMFRDAEGHRYLPKFAPRLTAEKLGALDYIVGFNNTGQGSLAHIIVFGSVNNAPVYDFYRPIRRRTEPFVEHIARIAEDSVFTEAL